MSGFDANVSFSVNTTSQQQISNFFQESDTAPIIDPSTRGVNTRPFQSIVSLILRKLCIALCLIIIGTLGLSSLIIGVIGHHRQCTSPRLPTMSVWLIVVGSTSIFLVIVLIVLIFITTLFKYKSSDKKVRIAFMITLALVSTVFTWSVSPGGRAGFVLKQESLDCLGFIYTYTVVILVITIICVFAYIATVWYCTWKTFCEARCKKKEAIPTAAYSVNTNQPTSDTPELARIPLP